MQIKLGQYMLFGSLHERLYHLTYEFRDHHRRSVLAGARLLLSRRIHFNDMGETAASVLAKLRANGNKIDEKADWQVLNIYDLEVKFKPVFGIFKEDKSNQS